MRVGLLVSVATAIAVSAVVVGGGGGGGTVTPSIYIAQTAAGAQDGTSCANAKAVTFFNTATNWSTDNSKPIHPGVVVGLCGTITTTLTLNGSGAVGNPITIYWTNGAALEQPIFSGISFVGGYRYLTFDGGTNGAIRSAVSGTASNGDGLANTTSGTNAFYFGATGGGYCDHCTFKNLTIGPLFVKTAGINSGADNDGHAFAQVCGIDITITNNTIHDTDRGVQIYNDCGHADTDIHIDHNSFYNINHPFDVASAPSGATVWFNNNHAYNYSNWDTPGNWYHHDGVHLQPMGNPTWTLYLYDNIWDGASGANLTSTSMYGESGMASTSANIYAFNNVIIADSRNCCGYWGTSDGHWYSWNNTIITETNTGGASTEAMGCWGGDQPTRHCTITNNLVSHAATFTGYSAVFDSGSPDYNLYADCVGSDCFQGGIATFGAYRTAHPTWDAHSAYTSNANLNASGVPQAGSAALGAGQNLTSFCNTLDSSIQSACRADINGNPRPTSAAWDVGAYEVS